MNGSRIFVVAAFLCILCDCGAELPADIDDYATRCVRLNAQPLPPYEGDPHKGWKNVYACNVTQSTLAASTPPYPDGTIIVKESRREGEKFTWLVATARKNNGKWEWDEYTRNFENEDHRRVLVKQTKCTGCHDDAKPQDYIFTRLAVP